MYYKPLLKKRKALVKLPKPFKKKGIAKNDTVFYDMYGSANYRKFIVSPFIENQILYTLVFRNTQFFYTVNDSRIYSNKSNASYPYRIGQKGQQAYADGSNFTVCTKYNEYILEVK